MTMPSSFRDRELQKFVECRGETAVRTKICQDPGEAVAVEIVEGTQGLTLNEFFEVSSVAAGTTLIGSYTVPVGKTFFIKEIPCSADNVCFFEVFIDTVKKDKARASWTNWNPTMAFNGLRVDAGSTIEIKVTHASLSLGDFNAKLIGSLDE